MIDILINEMQLTLPEQITKIQYIYKIQIYFIFKVLFHPPITSMLEVKHTVICKIY